MAMALGIIGGVVSAIGSLAQASATAAAANYNAKVNDRNAQVALAQGAAEAEGQRRLNEQTLGRMRAAYGDAGIDFAGDALAVFQDSATQGELDTMRVRYNAANRSQGYQDEATLNRMQASAATTAGLIGAASGLVSAGKSIFQPTYSVPQAA